MVYFHRKIYVPNTVVRWLSLLNLTRNETFARTPYFQIAFLQWKQPEVGLGGSSVGPTSQVGGILHVILDCRKGDRRCAYKSNFEARVLYSVCLQPQVSNMQCACAVFSSVTCLYHIFPHYLINDTIFGKKFIEHKICFVFFYSFCLKHFSY